MSTNPRPRPASSTSPDDEFILFIVGCVVLVIVLGSAGAFWAAGVSWLVEHHVLVSASAHPIVRIPGGSAAGLDGPRVAILVGALVALLAWGVSEARRVIARRSTIE